MRLILSIICLFFLFNLSAQQRSIDSLTLRLEEHTSVDSLKVRLLNELAYTYRSTNSDSSISIGNRALNLANKLDIPYERAWALNGLGSGYWMKANYPEVLRFTHESLEIFQEINNIEGIAQSYNTLANTYNMQGEHSTSLEYYQKTISLYDELNDQFNMARAHANIGRTYFMIGQFDEALKNLQIVIDDHKDTPDNILYPIALNTQGDVYQEQEKLDNALENYLIALQITEKLEIPRIVTYSTRGISEVYQKKGDLIESNKYALKTLSISRDIGYLENVKNAALIISENNKALGEFDKALSYYTQYTAAKDSMFNRDREIEVTKLKESFELAEKQKEIQLLQVESALQKENSKNQKVLLYGVILIGFLASVIGIVQFRKNQLKQKTNKRLTKLNDDIQHQKDELEITLEKLNETKSKLEKAVETKDKFFTIISHDLRGLTSQFNAAVSLLESCLKKKDLATMGKLVAVAEDSSQKMTRLLDNLLSWALQNKDQLPYSPEKLHLRTQIEETITLFSTQLNGKKVKVENKIDSGHEIYVDRNSMATVFRNLLSNAIKFTSEGKTIGIGSTIGEDLICINFTDEGVGIEQEKIDYLFQMIEGKSTLGTSGEKGVGIGLKLVQDFVFMNKGEIKVESTVGSGTTFYLSLPKC